MKPKPKLGVGRTIIFFPFHMDLRQMKRRYLSLTLYKLYGALVRMSMIVMVILMVVMVKFVFWVLFFQESFS